MDLSLVLVSQGIETTIDSPDDSGWGLLILENEQQRALEILRQYRAENRGWPWRQKITSQGTLFDWGSVGWVALVCSVFWVQARAGENFRDAGLMDSLAVSRGEWWRLFTAMFLHADIGHLAMNAAIGLLLLGLTMGRFGTGVGLMAAYLAGAGGNVATWLIYSEGHRSLGASGMVMGCAGLLASQAIVPSRQHSRPLRYILTGTAGGVMLFVLLGVSPGSDVLAHLGGFVSGMLLGMLLLLFPRSTKGTLANVFAGLTFCLLVLAPWWLALEKAAVK